MFHQFEKLANESLDRFIPLKRDQSRQKIYAAYRDVRDNINFSNLNAALTLFLNENLSKATQELSTKCNITYMVAEKKIIDSINAAGDFWYGQEKFLYPKGLILSSRRFHICRKELEPGSDFDTARKNIHGDKIKILREAVYYALTSSKEGDPITLNTALLKYVALHLMKDGPEKKFLQNKLAVNEQTRFASTLVEASVIVEKIAPRVNMPVPKNLLTLKAPSAPKPAPPPKVVTPPTRTKVSLAGAAPLLRMPQIPEAAALRTLSPQNLDELKTKGVLNANEIMMYQWLKAKSETPRTLAQAAARFQIPFKDIQNLVSRINDSAASNDTGKLKPAMEVPLASRHPSIKAHRE